MQIDGEIREIVRDFIFLGSKITADGDCSHEIKRHLFLGRKAMTNLTGYYKAVTLLCWRRSLVKSVVFPVVMYGCESWTIKPRAEKLMLLNCGFGEDSWESLGQHQTRYQASRSYRKSLLNIHWQAWCWSWNSNTLAAWFKELNHWEKTCCWEGLGARGEGDNRGWDGWMASLTR